MDMHAIVKLFSRERFRAFPEIIAPARNSVHVHAGGREIFRKLRPVLGVPAYIGPVVMIQDENTHEKTRESGRTREQPVIQDKHIHFCA